MASADRSRPTHDDRLGRTPRRGARVPAEPRRRPPAGGCRRRAGQRRSSRSCRRPGCSRTGSRGRSPQPSRRLMHRPRLATVQQLAEVALATLGHGRRRSGRCMSWSWVGRADGAQDADRHRELRAPMRESMKARYGSSACSSWTSRSVSVTPPPSSTTSGWRPCRRMPLSRSLPKIIGLPCSRTSIRSSRTSLSVKSRKAPSLKMLQFWRTSTNASRGGAGPLERRLEVLGVRVDRARDEGRLGRQRERERHDRLVDGAHRASTWCACRARTSARPGPWSGRRCGC